MKFVNPMVFAILASVAATSAAEPHRAHGSHEHGHGKLNVAQDGAALHIELESPAANIVGFEHQPSSAEDQEAVADALAKLEAAEELFHFPQEARCKLLDAKVTTPLTQAEHGDAHHEAEHHEKAHHEDHHGEHEGEHGHDTHQEAAHSDIDATWHFTCAEPQKLDRIHVRLFDAFPGTEALHVQYITGDGQGTAELTAAQAELRF